MTLLRTIGVAVWMVLGAMAASANTLVGNPGSYRGLEFLVTDPSAINHLFTKWGFQVDGNVTDIKWEGILIDRPHSAVLSRHTLDDAPLVVIHICGGGFTTTNGCKASLGHLRNSGADVIAAYAPSEIWMQMWTEHGYHPVRRHHVHKAARQILSDIERIVEQHPGARFSFSSASLGYPVFAALFGEDGKYVDQMRKLMTLEGAPRNSRIDVIGLTTPARGWKKFPFLSYPTDGGIGFAEGPEELFLTGVLAPGALLTLHDGESDTYYAPEVYSDHVAVYAFPYAISLLDPKKPETSVQKISRDHRDVHRAGVEWTIPTFITGYRRDRSKGGEYHAIQSLQIGEGSTKKEAIKLGLEPAAYDWHVIEQGVSRRRALDQRIPIPQFEKAADVSGVALGATELIGEQADLSEFAAGVLKAAKRKGEVSE